MLCVIKNSGYKIKRLVNNLSKPSKFISIVYSILFGISGSAFLTLIPLKNTSNLGTWVISLYLIIAIASLILAIIFLIVEKRLLKDESKSVGDINTEFEEIESLYNPPKKE